MKNFHVLAVLAALLVPFTGSASQITHDDDISGTVAGILDSRLLSPSLDLKADSIARSPLENGVELSIRILRTNGTQHPVQGLLFFSGDIEITTGTDGVARIAECTPRSQFRLQAELKDQQILIGDGSSAYRIRTSVDCGTRLQLTFNESSDGGQPLSIWRVAQLGVSKVRDAVGLGFWNSPLEFVWPESGDYYSFGAVHITRGDHWDVVGHEMGHGIYDLGNLGAFGGGQHKIDECYSEALALSEGWASYFSGWISVDLADPDAKFETMVPRRAPIQFENVPSDVCNGPTNEWRVTSFLWDLVDTHQDGESANESFARLWRAMQSSRASSIRAAASLIEHSGVSKDWMDLVWELNFKTPR